MVSKRHRSWKELLAWIILTKAIFWFRSKYPHVENLSMEFKSMQVRHTLRVEVLKEPQNTHLSEACLVEEVMWFTEVSYQRNGIQKLLKQIFGIYFQKDVIVWNIRLSKLSLGVIDSDHTSSAPIKNTKKKKVNTVQYSLKMKWIVKVRITIRVNLNIFI